MVAKTKLLFYDLETSGLDKSFDQVLQFAAVETDLALNKLASYEWWVKLNPDLWPSPKALAVTHISLTELAQYGRHEYEVVRDIHALFNRPGTITLGYNTLGFDDEFLRFSFHRNLLSPYTHQYANGCGRMDLYPMTIMRYLLAPDGINWPRMPRDGALHSRLLNSHQLSHERAIDPQRLSMKLEHLRAANGLVVAGASHNAMSDVLCTIEMARLLQDNREVWERSAACFAKGYDEQMLIEHSYAVDSELLVAVWMGGDFGSDRQYLTVACRLGKHRHYRNQELWLRLDVMELPAIDCKDVVETAASPADGRRAYRLIIRKKLGEPPFIMPYQTFYEERLDEETKRLVALNLQHLRRELGAWRDYWLEYKYPEIPNLDVDAGLYQQGFLAPSTQKACDSVHQWLAKAPYSGGDMAALVDALVDPQQEQLWRVLGRNFPHLLLSSTQGQQAQWREYLARALWGNDMVNHQHRARRSAQQFYAEWLACQPSCASCVGNDSDLRLSEQQQHELAELYERRCRQRVFEW